jgi:hypothetical protein
MGAEGGGAESGGAPFVATTSAFSVDFAIEIIPSFVVSSFVDPSFAEQEMETGADICLASASYGTEIFICRGAFGSIVPPVDDAAGLVVVVAGLKLDTGIETADGISIGRGYSTITGLLT